MDTVKEVNGVEIKARSEVWFNSPYMHRHNTRYKNRKQYFVPAPDGTLRSFGPGAEGRVRASIWATLAGKCDLETFSIDKDHVPTEVALLGKPAIAAWMFAVHRRSVRSIAEMLDVKPETTVQYFNDISVGRRLD